MPYLDTKIEEAEKEAKEKAAKEAKEKAEKEAKDKAEKEAKEKAVESSPAVKGTTTSIPPSKKTINAPAKAKQGSFKATKNLDFKSQATAAAGVLASGAAAYFVIKKNDDEDSDNYGFGSRGQMSKNNGPLNNLFGALKNGLGGGFGALKNGPG